MISTRGWSIVTFFSLFLRMFILREAQFTLSRDSKRTSRRTSCQSDRPLHPALVLVFRRGNIRGIDVFVSLRQADKTMKNGKTCSSSCVEDETAIITCSNAHRSFERGGYPPPFKYLGYTYLRTERIQAESWCVRKRVPDSFYFLRALFFCISRATRLVEPIAGHGCIEKVISCSFPRVLDKWR